MSVVQSVIKIWMLLYVHEWLCRYIGGFCAWFGPVHMLSLSKADRYLQTCISWPVYAVTSISIPVYGHARYLCPCVGCDRYLYPCVGRDRYLFSCVGRDWYLQYCLAVTNISIRV